MDAHDGSDEHRPYEDMAVAHVLGGLDTDQGRVFRSHLLECSDCRARVGELRAIASDLAGVERDERRQRSARAVETKHREVEDADEPPPPPNRDLPRWVVFGLALAVIAIGSYAFVLRTANTRLEGALEQRLEASAAMEHGDPLAVDYRAAGLTATAKVHEGRVALLIEGLDDETAYGVYLLDDQESGSRTTYRHPLIARDGKVFVLLPLGGQEDRLMVTIPERAPALDPDGQRVLEVLVPNTERPSDTIGSA
jgi:hypothetical protein